jgi:hypothetical protein
MTKVHKHMNILFISRILLISNFFGNAKNDDNNNTNNSSKAVM